MHAHMGDGQHYFLDKTPANALVLPLLTKVYPNAKYIILTRHPAAIFASYANPSFDGDYDAAGKFTPILSLHSCSSDLKNPTAPFVHVTYEGVASNPEAELKRISFEIHLKKMPSTIKSGCGGWARGSLVLKADRPVTLPATSGPLSWQG